MQDRTHKLLRDMLVAAQAARRFCNDMSADAFEADEVVCSAVERQLIILGEAMFQISQIEPEWEQLLPSGRQLIRYRHVLVHGYEVVAPRRSWRMAAKELPRTIDEVEALLASDV